MNQPMARGCQCIEIDPSQAFGQPALVISREVKDDQIRKSVHQCRWRLEVASMAFDDRATRVIKLTLGGRPAGQ